MPGSTATASVPMLSATSTKMDTSEDRKRPMSNADDLAPPRKKHAVNGAASKDEWDNQPEEAWVDNFARGAIYRRMREYKRESIIFAGRLEELHKRSLYHDDHLRIVDAWWSQLLDEIELISNAQVPPKDELPDPIFVSSIAFKDSENFQRHLDEKHDTIKTKAESLITRLASCRTSIQPETADLECRISSLMALQKEHLVELDRLHAEKVRLEEQLDTATTRCLEAEKKLDRTRSLQVQRLEGQAIHIDPSKSEVSTPDGRQTPSDALANASELQTKYDEQSAVVKIQKQQIDSILAEVKTLQTENQAYSIKKSNVPSEEDFAQTELFKAFKAKNEELIKQINHMEATNSVITKELEKMKAERSAFKQQLELDKQTAIQSLDADVVQRDADLARVRSQRDGILAELSIQKQSQQQYQRAAFDAQDLISAKENRIKALESELNRLRPRSAADGGAPASADTAGDAVPKVEEDSDDRIHEENESEAKKPDTSQATQADPLTSLSIEELVNKYHTLEREFAAINTELSAMELAYKKAMIASHGKLVSALAMEERIAILSAEKGKADQKYFAARKDADTRLSEIRSLRSQNGKGIELISQLKDVEAQNRSLLANLEKQLADARQSNVVLTGENKRLLQRTSETQQAEEACKKEINELKSRLKSKENASMEQRSKGLSQEAEIEKLKVRLEAAQKDRDSWKRKADGSSSDVEKGLRTLMICSICNENFKNTVVRTCGHLFCGKCVDARIANRMRKCPTCSRAFDRSDVMAVHH